MMMTRQGQNKGTPTTKKGRELVHASKSNNARHREDDASLSSSLIANTYIDWCKLLVNLDTRKSAKRYMLYIAEENKSGDDRWPRSYFYSNKNHSNYLQPP